MLEKIIGCGTSHIYSDGKFCKYYQGCDENHWRRIKKAALDLSDAQIGPHVFEISDSQMSISYQIVDEVGCNVQNPRLCLSPIVVKECIIRLVSGLHSLGYGHGDLHLGNIGFSSGCGEVRFYILDHDTVYRINEMQNLDLAGAEWLAVWMREGFDWKGTFQEFVDYDFENWQTDWLEVA
jgi:hypothetical protein